MPVPTGPRRQSPTRWHQCLTTLIIATWLSGCGASASKRYEQGLELQQQGQYIEAAQKYIEALRKDPGYNDARTKLREVGPIAVTNLHRSADLAAQTGRAPDAADGYLRLDAFLASASAVGEPLAPPEGYRDQRRAIFDDAIASLAATGAQAEAAGEWYTAKRAYQRADRYYPDPGQVQRLMTGMIRTHLGWCESDIDLGRYRSAVDHADQAYDLATGSDPEAVQTALELRNTAIELGTIAVAIAPMWRTDDAARFVPDGFVTALNDELELMAWSDPPLFIAVLDPREVRRALRDLRYQSTLMTVPEAARLGRSLGVDAVLTGNIELFTITERDVSEEVRNASTKSGKPVTYLRRSGTLDYRMKLRYVVVDVTSQRQVRGRTVEVTESGRFQKAVYQGDWTALDLTRNERRWFEADRQQEYTLAIEDELLNEATIVLSDRAYRDMERLVE